ncbi:hypothetical protein BGW80DRAFT_1459392 [Lactifluus volemus]|nr:hypothetical protein BGW80DRAFT_1459392 [Lactifluus volemus]
MKTSSLTKSNRQEQWQELLARVQELAKTTSDENVQLVKKVKELEVELGVWKQAVSNERNVEKHIALCVIDGTRSAFSANYIAQGEEGGKKAGQEIVRAITEYLSDDKSLQDNTPKLSITIFVRKTPLRNDLVINNFCSPEQFDEFFAVLNQTPHLNIIEVDSRREANKKIEDHLQLFAGLPQTVRIFFSGGNGSEYLPILEACTASSKLLPGLFTKGSFAGQPNPSTPLPPHSPSPFPLAEADDPDTDGQRRQAFLDPNLPLYKQNPPPCNEYYLMESCSKEGRCRYSHEYDLTDEHLDTLAKSARQSPCWFLNNGSLVST